MAKKILPRLPYIPDYATNNAHMFYLLFPDLKSRTDFIAGMKARDILTVFHYLPLHSSEFYKTYSTSHPSAPSPTLPHQALIPSPPAPGTKHQALSTIPTLPNCDRYADTLVRLPLYCGLAPDQDKVFKAAKEVLKSISHESSRMDTNPASRNIRENSCQFVAKNKEGSHKFSREISHESTRIDTNPVSRNIRENSCQFVAKSKDVSHESTREISHESTRIDTNLGVSVIRENSCQFVANNKDGATSFRKSP